MADTVVKSKMFPGINTTEAAMGLFLLCQSEGLHPMQALTRYHVIQGRPAMKADAMLAEFMRRGGTVNWIEWNNDACEAEFKSQGCPEGVNVRWTMEDAKRAGVTINSAWTKYPRQMLKARVASDGVRMTDPAVNQGRYTPEEVSEFTPGHKVEPAEIVAPEAQEESLEPLLEASIERVRVTRATKPKIEMERSGPGEIKVSAAKMYDEDKLAELTLPSIFDPESIAKDVAAKLALEGEIINGSGSCPKCSSGIAQYTSQKGVTYEQCEAAHQLFVEAMQAGATKAEASKFSRDHHYRIIP